MVGTGDGPYHWDESTGEWRYRWEGGEVVVAARPVYFHPHNYAP